MRIGCLGDVAFEVSDSVIKTLTKATWSGSAKIQTHQRHLDNALQEFVGIDPDAFTFTIKLSRYLGADPMTEVVKIFEYERGGIAVPLTLGNKAYGKYRWLVKSHKVKLELYDGRGNLTSCDVDVTLTEYTKE